MVRIQAEGRLVVAALKQLQPFIRATVLPLCDDAVVDEEGLQTAVEQLRLVMRVSRMQCNIQHGMWHRFDAVMHSDLLFM